MGLQLPGELVSVLGMLGYTWPEADETRLFEMGQAWMAFTEPLRAGVGDAHAAAQAVWVENQGSAVEAFQNSWLGPEAAKVNMENGAVAATMIGAGLMVCAGIVLTLKINVIVQLTLLAIEITQAIATAGPTLGASLAEIPIFKMITETILDQLTGLAMDAVLGG
ncbi:hypothetical protein [Actinoplanes teichomyceticus]|uniref:Outer membrane channel protein CpnT-like N-terminal domain-containing protein n=1 Tax=Actinoplanes teichomyceticus TaxID=1867 RepID=A0A561WIT5_ACTTI|nr:hypothetical protein [Actinoplanes teichomyceticus]TWG23743.1 hypothetical protein FHX34_102294 [Actinoplanes teichomyceticus]GIF11786.1 hypothetical protein Ate01nite_18180 [Actinoplanes teichomyceticus]